MVEAEKERQAEFLKFQRFNQLTSDPSQMASHTGHLTNLDYQYYQD